MQHLFCLWEPTAKTLKRAEETAEEMTMFSDALIQQPRTTTSWQPRTTEVAPILARMEVIQRCSMSARLAKVKMSPLKSRMKVEPLSTSGIILEIWPSFTLICAWAKAALLLH